MCEFSAYVVFVKATNGQTDIKQTRSLRGRKLFNCDLCNIGFQLSVYTRSCLCLFVACQRQRMPKIRTLFCLVDIKKRSFVTSCGVLIWYEGSRQLNEMSLYTLGDILFSMASFFECTLEAPFTNIRSEIHQGSLHRPYSVDLSGLLLEHEHELWACSRLP